MKLMLFLGSGVSLTTGLPNVFQITEEVLSGEWHSHTDSNFYPGLGPSKQRDARVARIQNSLLLLKEFVDAYQATRRETKCNYEDLFYLARQVFDDWAGNMDNPAVALFLSDLRTKTQHLCVPMGTELDFQLKDLADEACDFIQCVVWHLLRSDKAPQGLELITQLALADEIDHLDICTLNHDLLADRVLADAGVPFVDGFGTPDGQVRKFSSDLFDDSAVKVRIVKLHGSINWYRFRAVREDSTTDYYGISVSEPAWYCRNADGNLLDMLKPRPDFLTGSYNKMIDYGHGIFADIHHKFFRMLREHDLIVMSGYGWNDRGINVRLFEWLNATKQRRLILLHQSPETIRNESKHGMWHRYDQLVKQGRLIPVPKWLSEVSLDELLQVWRRLDNNPK